jgi:hypothetical protein
VAVVGRRQDRRRGRCARWSKSGKLDYGAPVPVEVVDRYTLRIV